MDFVGNRRVASSAALERKLRQDIYSCTLREGDLLASENQLIRKYKLSGYQIRKAVANLKKEGLLRSVRGSGTYVVSPEDRRKSAPPPVLEAGPQKRAFPHLFQLRTSRFLTKYSTPE